MRNNSVVILRPVLVRFYRTGEETAIKRHARIRVFIDKEQKQLLLNWETINPRMDKQTHTATVLQRGGKELRTIPR